jgi:hypothetical protein
LRNCRILPCPCASCWYKSRRIWCTQVSHSILACWWWSQHSTALVGGGHCCAVVVCAPYTFTTFYLGMLYVMMMIIIVARDRLNTCMELKFGMHRKGRSPSRCWDCLSDLGGRLDCCTSYDRGVLGRIDRHPSRRGPSHASLQQSPGESCALPSNVKIGPSHAILIVLMIPASCRRPIPVSV